MNQTPYFAVMGSPDVDLFAYNTAQIKRAIKLILPDTHTIYSDTNILKIVYSLSKDRYAFQPHNRRYNKVISQAESFN